MESLGDPHATKEERKKSDTSEGGGKKEGAAQDVQASPAKHGHSQETKTTLTSQGLGKGGGAKDDSVGEDHEKRDCRSSPGMKKKRKSFQGKLGEGGEIYTRSNLLNISGGRRGSKRYQIKERT